jgi:hypothetical protein
MKTRDEMAYDFMIALAANPAYYVEDTKMHIVAKAIKAMAFELANSYITDDLEGLIK